VTANRWNPNQVWGQYSLHTRTFDHLEDDGRVNHLENFIMDKGDLRTKTLKHRRPSMYTGRGRKNPFGADGVEREYNYARHEMQQNENVVYAKPKVAKTHMKILNFINPQSVKEVRNKELI
jgi:hypothetical protein